MFSYHIDGRELLAIRHAARLKCCHASTIYKSIRDGLIDSTVYHKRLHVLRNDKFERARVTRRFDHRAYIFEFMDKLKRLRNGTKERFFTLKKCWICDNDLEIFVDENNKVYMRCQSADCFYAIDGR